MTRAALITIAHGRHDRLAMQHRALQRSAELPGDYIIVAMDDPELLHWRPDGAPQPRGIPADAHPDGLPLAAARNVGAQAAMDAGADVLVFLDVDCMPDQQLITAYREAADDPLTRDTLLCGPVAYLDPPPPGGYDLDTLADVAEPHPARPVPAHGTVELEGNHDLFWSLSFALTAETWRRIGGFCEQYVGYGGEDTDFARTAKHRGVDLSWVGSARAYHQYHPTSTPPVQHVNDIVRNATLFRARWGEWPMQGWLDAFEERGLVRFDPATDRYTTAGLIPKS